MEIGLISEEWDDDDWVVVEYDWEKKQKEWGWSWGWVMNAGKKVVMAGIVLSSAPVLLPPMLLVSAIGVAMSVPSGVVLASYACTHKLMTKLLPLPAYNLQQQQEQEEEEEDDGYEPAAAAAAAAEMRMSEDIKNEIEMRIELVEDDKYNEVIRERGLEEGREMSSSSSSSSSENEDGEEIQVKQGPVLRNIDDVKQGNHGAVDVMVSDEEPKKVLKEEKDRHGVNGGLHSHGELISEEKIWEKIDAIRVIVGFKAPRRSSYVEEVKALYLFTGIEPPTPAEDESNLSHLTFLMSVIGLK